MVVFFIFVLRWVFVGEVDEEFVVKLSLEFEFEIFVKEGEMLLVSIKDFLENG